MEQPPIPIDVFARQLRELVTKAQLKEGAANGGERNVAMLMIGMILLGLVTLAALTGFIELCDRV